MSLDRLDDSLWFERNDGTRLYPWWRNAKKRGQSAYWVSDGSNLIEDADPVESIEALIHEVFSRGRSVWLRARKPGIVGLYRLGERAIRGWGATTGVKPLVEAAMHRASPAARKRAHGSSSADKPRVSAAALAAMLNANMAKLGATEREVQVRQRVGQALFRDALLDLWEGRCAVSGLEVPELLRASHAKPWAECASDAERLDPYNGLLLAPHLDVLFDRGYLTFDGYGEAIWSAVMPEQARAALGLADKELALRWIDPQHASYLEYHRAHVFRDSRREAHLISEESRSDAQRGKSVSAIARGDRQ